MRSVFAIAALAASAAAIKLTQDLPTEGEVMDFAAEHDISEEDVAAAIAEGCPECETEDDVVAFLKDNKKEIEKKIKKELELAQLPTEGECKDFAEEHGITEEDVAAAIAEGCPECEDEDDVVAFLKENEKEIEKKIKEELELAQQSEGEESEGDEPKEKKPKGEDTEGEESEEKKPKGEDTEGEESEEKKPKGDKPESGSDVESEEDLDVEELAQEDDVDMVDVEKDVKDFIDGLWEQADTNGDGTLDADEGEAALRWAAGKGYITEEEGMAIFDHVAEFAGEDGVVSKDEMFESAKAAAEEHPEYAEELYRDAKDAIEEAEVLDFIDDLWEQADTNGDDTIDADEGMAALSFLVDEGDLTEADAEAIFAHVSKFAGEDGVVSKEEMFDAAKAADFEVEE